MKFTLSRHEGALDFQIAITQCEIAARSTVAADCLKIARLEVNARYPPGGAASTNWVIVASNA